MVLKNELERRVKALVHSGAYRDADEVLARALDLVEMDDFAERHPEELEALIMEGLEGPGRMVTEADHEQLKREILQRVSA